MAEAICRRKGDNQMDFIRAAGKDIYAGSSPVLLRGFGLGGWFLPEGYMWRLYTKCDRPRRIEAMIEELCGKAYAEAFWQQYLDYYITENDIRLISEEGFNSVRLPLNARHLYEKKNLQFELNLKMFERIDRLIKWCKKYHIYVILDMHAAPGGQTGQNIDDSESDLPYLFMDSRYEEELTFLWKELAGRYCNEAAVAGYDLLNEPLPDFFSQYNGKVLPLYRKLIREIRKIDHNHMIILEGVHWASDFSVFDAFTRQEAEDNIMLQFHKYWNNPDAESLYSFIKSSNDLNAPLFMGEGGENNCDWYTTAFPMYEQLGIGWSFWTYKKMECTNSPVTFAVPEGWEELILWLDEKGSLSSDRAVTIFDHFIQSIKKPRINQKVLHALKRELPVKIPCEAYQDYQIISKRIPGAKLRATEPVSLVFENGKVGEADYKRMGGEEQPPEENILVSLQSGDSVGYVFTGGQAELEAEISAEGEGVLRIAINSEAEDIPVKEKKIYQARMKCIPGEKQYIRLSCTVGNILLNYIYLS